jgi:hypothetical protein
MIQAVETAVSGLLLNADGCGLSWDKSAAPVVRLFEIANLRQGHT